MKMVSFITMMITDDVIHIVLYRSLTMKNILKFTLVAVSFSFLTSCASDPDSIPNPHSGVNAPVSEWVATAEENLTLERLNVLSRAIDAFGYDNERFLTKEEGLKALIDCSKTSRACENAPYLTDPKTLLDAWGRPIQYSGGGKYGYDVFSLGADGIQSNDDLIVSLVI